MITNRRTLDVTLGTRAGVAHVAIRGELDISTSELLHQCVVAVIDERGPGVVLDLSGVTFCDSRGLNALVRVANHAAARGGAVRIVNAPALVRRVLRITGLDRRFLGTARTAG